MAKNDGPTKTIVSSGTASDRQKALATAMSQIKKSFGKGAIMMLGAESKLDVHVISTGSLSLDLALGVGGIAKGRITEVYGPKSGGKTIPGALDRHAVSTCR